MNKLKIIDQFPNCIAVGVDIFKNPYPIFEKERIKGVATVSLVKNCLTARVDNTHHLYIFFSKNLEENILSSDEIKEYDLHYVDHREYNILEENKEELIHLECLEEAITQYLFFQD